MKTFARIAPAAMFALAFSITSAPSTTLGSFEHVTSVTSVETITVAGSVGIDL